MPTFTHSFDDSQALYVKLPECKPVKASIMFTSSARFTSGYLYSERGTVYFLHNNVKYQGSAPSVIPINTVKYSSALFAVISDSVMYRNSFWREVILD